jgi:hypothetical protein
VFTAVRHAARFSTLLIAIQVCTVGLAPVARAKNPCAGRLGGALRCQVVTGPIGPISPGVLGGTEYVSDPLECGPRRVKFGDAHFAGDDSCREYLSWCPLDGAQIDSTKEIVVYHVYDAKTNAFKRIDIGCDVPVGAKMPSIAAIKQEVTKYAPEPRATAGGTRYLMSAAIVFYALPSAQNAAVPTLTDIAIPKFDLGGHTFTAQLHLQKMVWSWGDGSPPEKFTADNGGDLVGQPYDDHSPCESDTVCSKYISHVFTRPGTHKVTTEAHWTATFTLDGAADRMVVPGDIFKNDTAGRTVTILQARSVLVAPSPR